MTTAAAPKLAKSQVVPLSEASITEAALEKAIAEDPGILGLGEVVVIERQRKQERAGRLDLLLEDAAGEQRFEVELMLGSLDESHLIRSIEYWDIERRHYPGYEHRAVIIAEDITSRFLNVIQLFSGSVPIIAIQVNCIKVGETAGLNFIKLVDSTKLRRDDKVNGKGRPSDRNDWLSYLGPEILAIADECVSIINAIAKQKRALNYNKEFIGLTDGIRSNNFVYFSPRKSLMRVHITMNSPDVWAKKVQDSGIDFKAWDDGTLSVNLKPQTLREHRDLITQILQQAVKDDES